MDYINAENNKIEMKIKLKEDKIKKISEEYSKLLNEKINYYENLNNETKNKYENIIKSKDTIIKELEENIKTYKREKDKYLYDYNLIRGEYDKIYQQFHIENNNYIKQYEEAQNKINNLSSDYLEKINELNIKIENLENENKRMKSEINSFNKVEKTFEQKILFLERNENELNRINSELKKNNDEYIKKNASYSKEIERLQTQFKKRLAKDKEYNENKIIYLENMVEKQKTQLSLAEGKALDMVKKQQMLTEKYKKELQNAVSHYENIINGRI